MKWLNKKIIGGRNCLKCVCGFFSEDDTADADHLQTQLKNILTQVKVCGVRSLSFVLFFICFFHGVLICLIFFRNMSIVLN